MKTNQFLVVNSFAEKTFDGNPAAVFIDAAEVDDLTMRSIAKQINLVETVFIHPVTKANADFYFRYFTPAEELPIAGHPTIAAILALIKCQKINMTEKADFIIQTNAGNLKIKITENQFGPVVMMEQPQPQFLPLMTDRYKVADIFGLNEDDLMPDLPVQPVSTGLGHLIVPLKSLSALMRVQRKIEPLRNFCKGIGIHEAQLFTFETYDSNKDLHTRNICPREGIEDPGCGVGNGALGAYLLEHYYQSQTKVQLTVEQGHIVDMPCTIKILAEKENNMINLWIGGNAKVMIEGMFHIE